MSMYVTDKNIKSANVETDKNELSYLIKIF